jgi:hypothetical protein
MINDNSKPNKVDMRGIQKKKIRGNVYDGFIYFLLIIFLVVVVFKFMQPKQIILIYLQEKTKVEPKI